MIQQAKYKCIAVGVSAGGTRALEKILPQLNANLPFAIVIVQHLHPQQEGFFIKYFNGMCKMEVKEANEKEKLKAGTVYFAPPNYHLLLEDNETFSLNVDPKVNYARPSIDIFFECAAQVYREKLVGIILTGANSDGAKGLLKIIQEQGTAVVQDPRDAEIPSMPKAAIKICNAHYILDLNGIASLINEFADKINTANNE